MAETARPDFRKTANSQVSPVNSLLSKKNMAPWIGLLVSNVNDELHFLASVQQLNMGTVGSTLSGYCQDNNSKHSRRSIS